MKNNYIVLIKQNSQLGIQLIPYLARVVSYKKGLEGIRVTFDIDKAHKYRNEKNAQKPAQLYNGEVKLI
jgi:hypothetical protein